MKEETPVFMMLLYVAAIIGTPIYITFMYFTPVHAWIASGGVPPLISHAITLFALLSVGEFIAGIIGLCLMVIGVIGMIVLESLGG